MKESGVKMPERERSCWVEGTGPEPPAGRPHPFCVTGQKEGAEGRAAAVRPGDSYQGIREGW